MIDPAESPAQTVRKLADDLGSSYWPEVIQKSAIQAWLRGVAKEVLDD